MTWPAWVFWKESVFYIIVVSHYANYKTAISAHEGRQARKEVKESNNEPSV